MLERPYLCEKAASPLQVIISLRWVMCLLQHQLQPVSRLYLSFVILGLEPRIQA